MQDVVRRLFNLYEGEGKRVLLFTSLGFLWSWATAMGLRFANVSFLLHVGAESLPDVYLITSCGLIVISCILLYLYHITTPYRIFLGTLSCEVLFFSLAYFSYISGWGTESSWLWYSLRIFSYFCLTVNLTNYWTFVDQYQHMQDSKRMYGLFTSMIFLGRAVTGGIMQTGWVSLHGVLILVILLLSLVMVWVYSIRTMLPSVHEEVEQENNANQKENSFSFLIQSILQSPFTLILMFSNLLTFVLWVTTEFNYMSAFDQHFDPGTTTVVGMEEKAELTHFLGKCLVSVSIFNLIFGLFIYSRLVRRFGVSGMLFGTSLLFLFAFSGWQFDTTLFFPIVGYLIVEGMLDVMDDSNFTLLINAVPQKVKYKIRVMIESFVEPIGMLISGLLLSIRGINTIFLGLLLSIVLFIAAFFLRRTYLPAIFANLKSHSIRFQRSLSRWFQMMPDKVRQSNEYRLFGILKHGDTEGQRFAMRGLMGCGDSTRLKKLLQHAQHLHESVKHEVVQGLSTSGFRHHPLCIELLQKWSRNSSPELAAAAKMELAISGHFLREEALPDLHSPHPLSKIASIYTLRQHKDSRALANKELDLLVNSGEETCLRLIALGSASDESDIRLLYRHLRSSKGPHAEAAASTLARIATPDQLGYAPLVINEISQEHSTPFRLACLEILSKMDATSYVKELVLATEHFRPKERRETLNILRKMSSSILPTLLDIVKNASVPLSPRLLAGRVLGKMAPDKLRATLYDIISIEIDRATDYQSQSESLPDEYPKQDLRILFETLQTGYHSVMDFMIQLLGAAGELEDCELLSQAMRSSNTKTRSQVIEALEKTCEAPIFRLLYPLIALKPKSVPPPPKMDSSKMMTLLNSMIQSPAQLDRIVAIVLKQRWNISNWKKDLHSLLDTQDPLFHHFAHEMLS